MGFFLQSHLLRTVCFVPVSLLEKTCEWLAHKMRKPKPSPCHDLDLLKNPRKNIKKYFPKDPQERPKLKSRKAKTGMTPGSPGLAAPGASRRPSWPSPEAGSPKEVLKTQRFNIPMPRWSKVTCLTIVGKLHLQDV